MDQGLCISGQRKTAYALGFGVNRRDFLSFFFFLFCTRKPHGWTCPALKVLRVESKARSQQSCGVKCVRIVVYHPRHGTEWARVVSQLQAAMMSGLSNVSRCLTFWTPFAF